MKIIGIYKIENKINGKIYIGQSVDIKRRIRTHKYHAYNAKDEKTYNLYLYVAMRKYGKENFTYTIIEQCEKELLDEREKYWIRHYKSNLKEFGYNLSDGGNSKYVSELTKSSNISIRKQKIDKIKYLLINTEYPLRDTRKKTFYYCPKCGNRLSSKQSKLCKKCDAERQHIDRGHFPGIYVFERDLNNYGLRELGKKYRVSEQTIYRWSKKYNMPLKGWKQERRLKYEQVQQNKYDQDCE